jgi:hypothetical protein
MPRQKKIFGEVVRTTALIPKDLYGYFFEGRKEHVASTINEALATLRAARQAKSGHKPTPQPISTNEPDRWHRMLSAILASGDTEVIQAIQQNLKAFSRVSQLFSPKPTRKERAVERGG